ncbi:hypothetical protein F5Y00DRAFT_228661 [Daldinia vernicosa]|uniref:uncharacterized protein n=1 Tax=Daldinia vernicosa TaxID=114800 RepID=UPI00200766BF|nr:uncharacterized protein F5Y00DRAFT_228661 [Daldinia vernicosa]KAI0852104.1 hypothetical protein F5Y00DRAFT_228661 [Daldinia vernicosa]
MAPELRKRKSKEAGISAVKPTTKPASKGKADILATKRKAADDASPIATKKSKSIKDDSQLKKAKTDRSVKTKLSKSAKESKKDDSEVANEDETLQSSDDERDDAQALANVVDSDEEDAIVDTSAQFQEGQDVGEIPQASKELLKSSSSEDGERGVVYVGRLPHGFYEHEMRSYFSQFGKIEKLRMSRNKKTGASKHFAFIEFASAAVASIVSKTMDNYLLFGRILKVKVVPKSQIHADLWKGSNRRFKKVPLNKMAGNHLKKPLTESTWTQKITKEEQKRNQRAKKLQGIGYDFEGPKIKSVDEAASDPPALEGVDGEAPKAIEAVPGTDAAEAEPAEKEAEEDSRNPPEDEIAVKEPAKASKKGKKKSSKVKTKKVAA